MLIAHLSALFESWGSGQRVALEEAAPVWLTGIDDLAERLVEAELIDSSRRIPDRAWLSWFGAASHRRDDRRFEGMVGGLMRSLGLSKPEAQAEARRRLALGGPDVDLGPPDIDLTRSGSTGSTDSTGSTGSTGSTDSTDSTRGSSLDDGAINDSSVEPPVDPSSNGASAWSGFGPEWEPFRAAWSRRGFRKPPTPKQREAIWPAVDARPTGIVKWIDDAPGRKSNEVLGYIFAQWKAFKADAASSAEAADRAAADRHRREPRETAGASA